MTERAHNEPQHLGAVAWVSGEAYRKIRAPHLALSVAYAISRQRMGYNPDVFAGMVERQGMEIAQVEVAKVIAVEPRRITGCTVTTEEIAGGVVVLLDVSLEGDGHLLHIYREMPGTLEDAADALLDEWAVDQMGVIAREQEEDRRRRVSQPVWAKSWSTFSDDDGMGGIEVEDVPEVEEADDVADYDADVTAEEHCDDWC